MKRYLVTDLLKKVLMLDGTPAKIVNPEGTDVIEFTVRDAFRRALNGTYPDENNPQQGTTLSFEKKMERYELSKKILFAETMVDLKTEEQAELKKCVGKMFNQPEVLGFLNEIMESNNEVEETASGKKTKNNLQP